MGENSRTEFINIIPEEMEKSIATTEIEDRIFAPVQATYTYRSTQPPEYGDTKSVRALLSSKEDAAWINSSIICESIAEEIDLDMDEDTQVTITISDTVDEIGSIGDGSPSVQVTKDALSLDPFPMRKCLEQCLKMASAGHCVCSKTSACTPLQSPEYMRIDEANSCAFCGADTGCFLCSETYTSYSDLREHLIRDHSLSKSVDQLSNLSSEYIAQVAKEVMQLECKCTDFVCFKCKVTFPHLLSIMLHVLLIHPTSYGDFSFFSKQSQSHLITCQRCMILEKLCHVNYYLFVRVLLNSECSDDTYDTLLLSWPSGKLSEHCEECALKGESEELLQREKHYAHDAKREVACFRVVQKNFDNSHPAKTKSECICPLIKCPSCPKTVANFADLRKHIRLNDHSNWYDLRLVWDKYRQIKVNCPVCPKYTFKSYILCPHCPHLSFENEKMARTHMDFLHNSDDVDNITTTVAHTCSFEYLCLTCNANHCTPQSLHHHMRKFKHETQDNHAAIPTMIQRSEESKKKCAQCSLLNSFEAPETKQKEEDEEKCTCKWVQCSTCKNSYGKISALLSHMHKKKHPVSVDHIRGELTKSAKSVSTCQKCNSGTGKYCILCRKRENLISHMRTYHQDQQIMLLKGEGGDLQEEHTIAGRGRQLLARYECSVCSSHFLHITELQHHVLKQHPHCYFIVYCIDLSEDTLTVKDFAAREEIMILNVVTIKSRPQKGYNK